MALSVETPHLRESIREQTRQVMGTLIAASALLCFVSLFSILSLCIKLESRGPVFVRQKRLGVNNVPFDLLKFRTMYVEQTDPLGHQLIRAGDNPPTTRVGRFLRRMAFDELPQLINVLRGDISLVGPRPLSVVDNAAAIYTVRHCIKPGITGLAQVNQREGETGIERARRSVNDDLYYIENRSITSDLLILRRTVAAAVLGRELRSDRQTKRTD